jgi:hypothetical protein
VNDSPPSFDEINKSSLNSIRTCIHYETVLNLSLQVMQLMLIVVSIFTEHTILFCANLYNFSARDISSDQFGNSQALLIEAACNRTHKFNRS